MIAAVTVIAQRTLVQKQLHLLPSNVYILSAGSATSLLDQVQHNTTLLASRVAAPPAAAKKSNAHAAGIERLDAEERAYLSWLQDGRLEHSETARRLPGAAPPCAWQTARDAASAAIAEAMLVDEMESLCVRLGVSFWYEEQPWGFAVLAEYRANKIGIEVPTEYPAERFRLVPHCGTAAAEVAAEVETQTVQVFAPVSLTVLLALLVQRADELAQRAGKHVRSC